MPQMLGDAILPQLPKNSLHSQNTDKQAMAENPKIVSAKMNASPQPKHVLKNQ